MMSTSLRHAWRSLWRTPVFTITAVFTLLIGIGASELAAAEQADPADLVDRISLRTAEAERAIDRLREKFGRGAVIKGLAFKAEDE